MLDIYDLCVRYLNRSKPAVTNLSLSVRESEFVLLVGDSASGKSTLMQAVCGFIPNIIPAEISGEIRLRGQIYSDPAEIARIACMVQQDPEMQFCTEIVEEEVAFGPENFRFSRDKIEKAVQLSLKSVNASHLRYRKLSTLSGGEKQKVAIASMLAVEPSLIILDEPTSSLDPKSVSEVIDAISNLRKSDNITTVVVEHRISDFIDMATRIVTMENGGVVTDAERYSDEFERIQSHASLPSEYPETAQKGIEKVVSVRNLSCRIDNHVILENISFDINAGSIVALMGENGAGKTTLLRQIAGLIGAEQGEIRILSHHLSEEKKVEPWVLGRDIGLVFQNPNHQIFENSIEEEILFSSKNFQIDLEKARLSVEEYEKTEKVGRRLHPHCLSFGQKRRLNISSSSSHSPDFVMLDEPFAGQDGRNAGLIVNLLADLQKNGKTIIVVTHDQEFARRFCTDVILLRNGRLFSVKPSVELFERHEDLFRMEDR